MVSYFSVSEASCYSLKPWFFYFFLRDLGPDDLVLLQFFLNHWRFLAERTAGARWQEWYQQSRVF